MIKKMFALLMAVLFVVPFVAAADDFDDDFGGDFEEDGEESEEDEKEDAPRAKESDSDAAMRDLMGEPAKEAAPKKEYVAVSVENEQEAEESGTSVFPKGLKPVLLVKGGFTVFGQYKEYNGAEASKKTSTMNSMFGSVDEGILGLKYDGEHVIAKGTINLRTDNALIEKAANNPLMKNNLHSIQDGAANMIYEVYGGVKFYDVFIKAGNMIPEYGLVDSYQELGMGFATPFLSRSLVVVEGFLPETDAGLSLGYNSTFQADHNVFAGFTLGTGSNKSEYWDLDKTMGIYARVGYGFKDYVKAAVAFQYRTDYVRGENFKKDLDMTGIGVHLKGGYAGFEIPVSFDYNMLKLVKETKRKNATGMLLSLAPGYAYHFDHEWIDKVALAVRFDLVQGVYLSKEGSYLDYKNYKSNSMVMRIGATANFFTKELAGVRGMAGLTFLMQPKSKVDSKDINEDGNKYDYGFTTIMLQAGAEF